MGTVLLALLRDEQVDELVGQRVGPAVPVDQVARRRDHQPVVLAQRDGPRGLDLLDRQRAHRAQHLDARVDLHAHRRRRLMAKHRRQLHPRRVQHLFGVRHHHRVRPRRVPNGEAPRRRQRLHVLSRLLRRRLRQLQELLGALAAAQMHGLLQRLHRLRVPPPHQRRMPRGKQHPRISRRRRHRPRHRRVRARLVPRPDRLPRRVQVRLHARPRRQRKDHHQRPRDPSPPSPRHHFTSSS
jgi:hypothetical protein